MDKKVFCRLRKPERRKAAQKRTTLLLSAALLLSLAACGGRESQSEETPSAQPTPSEVPVSTPVPEETAAPAQSDKVLVAYYSATGHTGTVAQTIVDTLGADLFEITPAVPYTTDDLNYRDENSRVSQEHEDPARQTVELAVTTPDNWEDYGTVFIGYPIWWQSASWVVTSFVAANDFEGKTVIPFCTSASSGLGESDRNLAAAANGGDWLPGERFRSSAGADEVNQWLEGLDLPADE